MTVQRHKRLLADLGRVVQHFDTAEASDDVGSLRQTLLVRIAQVEAQQRLDPFLANLVCTEGLTE